MHRQPMFTHRQRNTHLNEEDTNRLVCELRLIYTYCTHLFSSVKAIVMPELQYELTGFV